MKLGEALFLRADLQKRIEQIRERLQASVLVEVGEQPPEDPQTLLAESDRIVVRLTTLIVQINRTNMAASLPDGSTMTTALAQRDALKQRVRVLNGAVEDTRGYRAMRFRAAEIRRVPTVEVRAIRQQADIFAQQHRALDIVIQRTNWETDLIE